MVQVLPAVPTFGNRLAAVLGQVGEDFGEAFKTRHQKQNINALSAQITDPNISPLQKITAATKLASSIDPQIAKAVIPLYAPFIFGESQQTAGTTPGQPQQPGVPQGTAEPITSETQPTQPNAQLNPTGQTPSGKEARKKQLLNQVGLPYGIGDKAKEELKDMREADKLTAKAELAEEPKLDEIQKQIIHGDQSAKISDANLNRMEVLVDKDEMITPLGAYLTNLFGVPVSLTSNADTEEFQKLAAQRGLNVAQAYGFGRILQTEFNNFLQTIPSLLNSPEGKERIIHTLRYFDNIAKDRYKVYKDVLKENGGKKIKARDLEFQLSERMEPVYKKFGEVLAYGDELVTMQSPDGQSGQVPKNQVKDAERAGYKLVESK